MTIRLHVERLVVEGMSLTGAERARLEGAVVSELTRLLEAGHGPERAHGLLGEGGAVAGLRGAEVRLRHGDSTATLGVQVARSVYGAMMPTTTRGNERTPAPTGDSAGRAR